MDDFLQRIDRFIKDHVQEKINTARQAMECGISVRTLCNKFHQHAGVSPGRYMKNRRLHYMHLLLSHSARGAGGVTDLAFELGFNHWGGLPLVTEPPLASCRPIHCDVIASR